MKKIIVTVNMDSGFRALLKYYSKGKTKNIVVKMNHSNQ